MNELLLQWVLKPALVCAAAYAGQLLVHRRGAAARHLVWCAAIAFLGILPLLPTEPPVSALAVAIPLEAGKVARPPAPKGTGMVEDAAPFVVDATAAEHRWTFPIHLIWIAGMFAVSAHWYLSFLRARRLQIAAADAAEYQGVPVRFSERTGVPFTLGFLSPVIVLPEASKEWAPGTRGHVLAHEYAHVARRDWLVQTAARFVCAMYWFHPLVWLAAAALRRESEKACDDAAIHSSEIGATGYASDLLNLAREGLAPVPGALAMWGRSKSQLEVRVMHIVNPFLNRRPVNGFGAAMIVCGALALFLPVMGVRLQAQPAKIRLGGEVRDPSGAAVPGAKIELRTAEVPGVVATSGATGPDGSISMEIAPGSYTFSVLYPGFAPVTGPLQLVHPDHKLFIALRIGQIRETMSVIGVRPASAPPPEIGRPQRIRVGGNVQAASLIHKVEPLYPANLQSQNIEGHIELDAVISKEGNVVNLHSRSLGQHPGLVQAAMDAVKQWRYKPTLLNGEPVEILTTVTVRFLLN